MAKFVVLVATLLFFAGSWLLKNLILAANTATWRWWLSRRIGYFGDEVYVPPRVRYGFSPFGVATLSLLPLVFLFAVVLNLVLGHPPGISDKGVEFLVFCLVFSPFVYFGVIAWGFVSEEMLRQLPIVGSAMPSNEPDGDKPMQLFGAAESTGAGSAAEEAAEPTEGPERVAKIQVLSRMIEEQRGNASPLDLYRRYWRAGHRLEWLKERYEKGLGRRGRPQRALPLAQKLEVLANEILSDLAAVLSSGSTDTYLLRQTRKAKKTLEGMRQKLGALPASEH